MRRKLSPCNDTIIKKNLYFVNEKEEIFFQICIHLARKYGSFIVITNTVKGRKAFEANNK